MDYLQQVFGGLNPQSDPDAAVKVALDVIFADNRLNELSCLLTEGNDIGGVEGEPGWLIERRDMGPAGELPYYAGWPRNARFHVHVEPTEFELAYSDMFMTAGDFGSYVEKAVDAYLVENPTKVNVAQLIISQLKKSASD